MRARIAIIIAALALLVPTASALAEDTRCSYEKCGALMQGITLACADAGSCQISDFTIVLGNIGNYILGIIGALVFLMYVIGGMYMLASGGNPERVEKGKKYIKGSTIGLAIVFFGFAGVWTLRSALTGAEGDTTGLLFVCDGSSESIGKPCGDNEICTEQGFCTSRCDNINLIVPNEDSRGGATFTCMSTDDQSNFFGGTIVDSCQPDLCPGDLGCCPVVPEEPIPELAAPIQP